MEKYWICIALLTIITLKDVLCRRWPKPDAAYAILGL